MVLIKAAGSGPVKTHWGEHYHFARALGCCKLCFVLECSTSSCSVMGGERGFSIGGTMRFCLRVFLESMYQPLHAQQQLARSKTYSVESAFLSWMTSKYCSPSEPQCIGSHIARDHLKSNQKSIIHLRPLESCTNEQCVPLNNVSLPTKCPSSDLPQPQAPSSLKPQSFTLLPSKFVVDAMICNLWLKRIFEFRKIITVTGERYFCFADLAKADCHCS